MKDANELRILGRQIRKLRRDRDLSQEALAEDAAMNRNHLSALERGVKEAGVLTLLKVAKALGVAPGRLFEPFDPQT